ncbi:MAG: hypothetical protein JWM50_2452 [Microbacteriaceae bacterium]|jgi:hypothetical protein|nr:hypothetical protein [Microbacteriaceae bacterium]
MVRLSPVLHAGDLPLAELHAARLDGELVALDEAFAPIDTAEGPAARAAALARAWSPRLIAEQRTAAWIWGALADAPARHQLCSSVQARARPPTPLRSTVREVVIDPDEVSSVAGLRVTTPLRTVTDLARFDARFGESEALLVRELLRRGGLTLDDCRVALERRRNLPAKRLAWRRIRDALGAGGS